jgi:hypothetical protein
MIPILALLVLAIAGFPAATVLAGSTPAGGQTLARMGGGMMGGQGGGMMGGQGYGSGGWGGHMGGGNGWFSGGNNYRDGYGNSYRQGEREKLRQELRDERQALSDMVHSGNADPDQVDRQMNRIENLEHRLDSLR